MPRKTIEVDSDMIDHSLEELSKLIIRLDNNPKKTRKDQNTIKKIKVIRDTIQDSVPVIGLPDSNPGFVLAR
jgi:hypothetical protein